MTSPRKLILPAALLVVAFALAGCGGSKAVSKDAVARVGGQEISKADFVALMAQAKRSYKLQKRAFPKAGTAERKTLEGQAVQFLVQREEFEQKAKDLGIEVADKDVNERLSQIKKQYFGGSEKRYRAQLAQQGLTEQQVKADIRSQLVSEGIFKKVTDGVKVTDKEIEDYYNENKKQFSQPASRDVRQILVKTKAQANRIYTMLQNGGDFAKLAKQYSQDPGSKDNGGKLTISKGQTVAPFDQTAFLLGKGKISKPVQTVYGYHIIQPLSAIRPAKTTPLKDVKESIRQQLLQQKRNKAMTDWVDEVRKDYCDGKLSYATGYQPTPDPCAQTGKTTTSSQ